MFLVDLIIKVPGVKCDYSAKHQTIQNIIDNLQISTLEYRNESDPDVSPYVHDRKVELIEVWTNLFVLNLSVRKSEVMGLTLVLACC